MISFLIHPFKCVLVISYPTDLKVVFPVFTIRIPFCRPILLFLKKFNFIIFFSRSTGAVTSSESDVAVDPGCLNIKRL